MASRWPRSASNQLTLLGWPLAFTLQASVPTAIVAAMACTVAAAGQRCLTARTIPATAQRSPRPATTTSAAVASPPATTSDAPEASPLVTPTAARASEHAECYEADGAVRRHCRRSPAGGLAAVVDHAAVLHVNNPLRGVGDRLVVGDEQDGLAARVEAGEELEYFFATV